MEWVETTGPTNELAIQEALEALGIEFRDAEVIIVSPAKKGIFGIAAKQARVRVRVKPPSLQRKKQYKKRNSYKNNKEDRTSYNNSVSQTSDQALGNQQKSSGYYQNQTQKHTDEITTGNNSQFNRQKKYKTNQVNKTQTAENDANLLKSRRSTPISQQNKLQKHKTDRKPLPEVTNILQKEVNNMDIEEKAKLAVSFLQELCTKFGFEANVEASIDDSQILINIDGSELGILVGPKGLTLDAIQEITRTIIQRNESLEERTKLIIDVSRYREKRVKALTAFVQNIGQEVIKTGVTKKLEPMSSSDRKIVHSTVSAIEGLKTRSEGFEPKRRVVIYKSTEDSDLEVFSK